MHRLEADVAGVRVSLACADARITEAVAERWRGFPMRAGGDACLAIEVRAKASPPPPPGSEYAIDLARNGSRLAVRGFWLDGEVDLERATGVADVDPFDAAGSVENFLRVALAHLLLPRGGFLLHAASVVTGRGAVVAFGPSGAGKTTLASLAGARPVISDDLVAIRRGPAGLVVIPTPFRAGGAPARPDGHRIVSLLRLKQAPRFSLTPLPAMRAAVELVGSMPFVHDDPGSAALALACASEAALDPGVSELAFTPDASVWDALDRGGRA